MISHGTQIQTESTPWDVSAPVVSVKHWAVVRAVNSALCADDGSSPAGNR